MPREIDEAWREVGRHVEELGSRIQEHFREQARERGQPAAPAGQPVADAFEALSRQLGSAVGAMGEAFHDQVVRERAIQASRAFADAVEASMNDVSRRVKKARKGGARRRDR
ncbi:MAG: hypothetical protein ABR977_07670 [Candidatus Dormibacteria bacterium]|jgi:hypothetical protein